MRKKQKIGLVLSGGGTRGLSHIGILKILEKENIKIDAIAGCSMGAIIGAFYASGRTPEEIKNFVLKKKLFDFFDFSISKTGINKTTKLQKEIEKFMGVKTFNKLKTPLFINATNITKGEEKVFSSGNIFQAIRASISIPGLFSPIKIGKDYFIDGGVLNQNPFTILPKKIKNYIIVNASPSEKIKNNRNTNLMSILDNSVKIMQNEITNLKLKLLNEKNFVLIEPNVNKNPILQDKRSFNSLILKGKNAARKKVNEIKIKFYY